MRQLLARRPEALVLTGGHHTAATRQLLQVIDAPILEVWDQPACPLSHVVGFSNAAAMEQIVTHLARAGRRRLGFLGASGASDPRGAERRRGVLATARQLGLPDVVDLQAGRAPVSMTDGAAAVGQLAAQIRGLDALVCVSDPVAFGAIMALQRMGVQVPSDIAVTGFGAFEIARIATPSITTVDVGAERIGAEAGQLVRDLLGSDGPTAAPQNIRIATELVPGGSS